MPRPLSSSRSTRARASACASCARATIPGRARPKLGLWRAGAGRALCAGPRDHRGGDGRARRWACSRSARPRRFYDYDAKYAPGGSDHLVPAPIHAKAYAEALSIALAAHQGSGLPRRQPRRSALRRHQGRAGAHGPARSQHPARHDADLAGAGYRAPCRHRLRRAWCTGWWRTRHAISESPADPGPRGVAPGALRHGGPRLLRPRRRPFLAVACGRARAACRRAAMRRIDGIGAEHGLAVDNVEVEGRDRQSKDSILAALGVGAGHADSRRRSGGGEDAARGAHLGALGRDRAAPARHAPHPDRASAGPSRSGSTTASSC